MNKKYKMHCLEGKARCMNNRSALACHVWASKSRLMAIDVSSFKQIASYESSIQIEKKRGYSGEEESREWNYLLILRCTLGQPILCPHKYQVQAELAQCKIKLDQARPSNIPHIPISQPLWEERWMSDTTGAEPEITRCAAWNHENERSTESLCKTVTPLLSSRSN